MASSFFLDCYFLSMDHEDEDDASDLATDPILDEADHGFDREQVDVLKRRGVPVDEHTLIALWNSVNQQTESTTRTITMRATSNIFASAGQNWVTIFFYKMHQHVLEQYGRDWENLLPPTDEAVILYKPVPPFRAKNVNPSNVTSLLDLVQHM